MGAYGILLLRFITGYQLLIEGPLALGPSVTTATPFRLVAL